IRYLLEQFQYIYNRLKDSNEIAIYNKYGNIAKRITHLVGICNHVYFMVIQCSPYVFNMIMPKNVTYVRHLIVSVTTHFGVQERYFYLVLLYLNATVTVGTAAILAVGTMLISCYKHICGMLRIASYRFDQAILATLQSITLKNKTTTYKEFIYAMDIHHKATELAKIIVDDMERLFFILIMITVICMSLNLYGHILLLSFVFSCICLSNHTGQEITDCNNHIFLTVYNAPWYLVPLKIQKLILFLLQRNNKAFTLNIGGLFTLSIERFASLMSTSVSYFTVTLSLQ
ncbi:hypothetical protein X777_10661, partial [Ooceraea biroi]